LLRLHSNLTFSNSSKYLSVLWSASTNSITLCFSMTCNKNRKVRQQVNYFKQRLLSPVFQIQSVFAHVFCWTSKECNKTIKRFVDLWSDIKIGNGRKTYQQVTCIMKRFYFVFVATVWCSSCSPSKQCRVSSTCSKGNSDILQLQIQTKKIQFRRPIDVKID
jgi:hypothetical protein